jgi:hypothetical protein
MYGGIHSNANIGGSPKAPTAPREGQLAAPTPQPKPDTIVNNIAQQLHGRLEVDGIIERMRADYHPDHEGVTVAALFVYDLESSEAVLKHGGYPAQAVVRITPVRDRALGVADAVIVIDRSNWLTLTSPQRDALLDHELYHLERVVEEDTQAPIFDAVDRPKLTIRRHDHQFGWFDEIANRHGEHSAEVRQARQLIAATGQLYLDFGSKPANPRPGPGMPSARH